MRERLFRTNQDHVEMIHDFSSQSIRRTETFKHVNESVQNLRNGCLRVKSYGISIAALKKQNTSQELIHNELNIHQKLSNDTEYRLFVGSFGKNGQELYGKNLTEELETFANDTVLVSVQDDKWHWTWKALSLMSWANDYCPRHGIHNNLKKNIIYHL